MWLKHCSALLEKNVSKLMEDYTSESTLSMYNYSTNSETHFAGLAGVETCFTLFLHHAADLTSFTPSVSE